MKLCDSIPRQSGIYPGYKHLNLVLHAFDSEMLSDVEFVLHLLCSKAVVWLAVSGVLLSLRIGTKMRKEVFCDRRGTIG